MNLSTEITASADRAAKSLHAIGWALLIYFGVISLVFGLMLDGPSAPTGTELLLQLALPLSAIAAIGSASIRAAAGLRRGERWALVLGFVVAGLSLAVSVTGAGFTLYVASATRGASLLGTLFFVGMGVALVRMFYDLRAAARLVAAREAELLDGRGFAVEATGAPPVADIGRDVQESNSDRSK